MSDRPSIRESNNAEEIVFIAPAPRMLRAGAVWVLIQDWVDATRRRWGKASVLTPSGFLTDDEISNAAWGKPTSARYPGRVGFLRRASETAIKDARAYIWTSRFDRSVRLKPPAVHPLFVWQYHSIFQSVGLRLAKQHDRPLVLFVDAPQVWESSRWGNTRPGWGHLVEALGETPQFKAADLLAVVTEEVAHACEARGADLSRIVVTPSTADRIRWASPTTDVRKSLNLPEANVVGWLGSFRSFHHAEMLVRATAILQREREVTLLMVGDGPTRHRCIQLAADLGVKKAIFPGPVRHDNIRDILEAFDVAVMTRGDAKQFHGSPLKLKEYLAAGRAVVAPAIGEVARRLRNGVDLLMYAPGNEAELAQSIGRLLEDTTLRTRLRFSGQKAYDRFFTMNNQLETIAARLDLSDAAQASQDAN